MSLSSPRPQRRLREHQLARSIDRFYEAATDPELWRGALQQFTDAAGAEGSMLLRHANTPHPTYVCSEGLDAAAPAFFAEDWHLRNQAIPRGASAAQRGVVIQTEWELFSKEDYGRDPFHMDFLRPRGFAWFAGFFLSQADPEIISLSAQRRACDEPFSRSELESIAKALPHLRRGGAAAAAFSRARAGGAIIALSMLEIPALLLDQQGRVCEINDGLSALLGNGLRLVQRRLVSEHNAINAALQRLICSLVSRQPIHETEVVAPVRVPRAFGSSLVVSGVPLAGQTRDVFHNACAIITIVDPDASRSRSELLVREAFGLTRAEAATANAIACGFTLTETAARRGVGLETVRSQLKSAGLKTGASSRGAMIALVNRILAATLDITSK